MQEPAATTVVLADDHAIVREGIAALCTSHGMSVLGQVADGGAAVEMIEGAQSGLCDSRPAHAGDDRSGSDSQAAHGGLHREADDPLDQPRGGHRNGSAAGGRRRLPAQRRSVASSAGRHQFCAGRRGICVADAAWRRIIRQGRAEPARRTRWLGSVRGKWRSSLIW